MTIRNEADFRRMARIGAATTVGAHRDELLAAIAYALEVQDGASAGFTVVAADDGRAATPATAAAARLLDAGADFVIGHFSASAALAAAPIYDRANIIFLAPGTTHPGLTEQGHRFLFRVCGRDTEQAAALMSVVERLAADSNAGPFVICQATPYGHSIGQLVEQALRRNGTSVEPTYLEHVPADDRLLPAGSGEEVVVIAGAHDFIAALVTRLRSQAHRGPFVASDDAYSEALLTLAGDAAEGIRVPVVEACGSSVDRLNKRFEREYGRRAGAYFLTSYTAASILVRAASGARATSSESVAAKIREKGWRTPLGDLSFNANGDVDGLRWAIQRVVNGRFVRDS
jgi:branched-chain amino acid transport system substrate-binding protein